MLSRFASLRSGAQGLINAARAYSTEATFHVQDFKIHTPSTAEEGFVLEMMTIRRFETAAGELYRGKEIRGFCHLYSGQEAIAVGMKAGLREDDDIISAYRVHGWAYVLGASVKQVIGELLGNSSGMSNGKGGSMHMYGDHFYGGNGIVGAQVPVGAGIALANKYQDKGTVCVSLYGDGASNQGQNFEAYNIAKLMSLPAIFVCENNKFGMGTSAERSSANTKYYTRGDYCAGIHVDGMDVLAVKQATEYARDYALSNGPIVMEMETYRYHGHSMSDPDTTYRTREDISAMRKSFDPIVTLKDRIVSEGMATEDELKKLEKDVRKAVTKEVKAAQAAPPTAMADLTNHVLSGEKLTGIRGCDVTISYDQA